LIFALRQKLAYNQSSDIHLSIGHYETKIMTPNGVSIVTTTWNERENIAKLVPMTRNVLQQIPHEIIIVDDNSPDGTIQVANRLADVAITKTREGQSKGYSAACPAKKKETPNQQQNKSNLRITWALIKSLIIYLI
jgi:glycosyltransferase involved in cell wall biosynthesis